MMPRQSDRQATRDARAMLACLGNERVAAIFAGIVLSDEPVQRDGSLRRRAAIEELISAGLIADDGTGALRFDIESVRRAAGLEDRDVDVPG
jgi:hypothetical protein